MIIIENNLHVEGHYYLLSYAISVISHDRAIFLSYTIEKAFYLDKVTVYQSIMYYETQRFICTLNTITIISQ